MGAEKETYIYHRGENPETDQEYEQAPFYGKVKLGKQHIFWKKGFRKYAVDLEKVQRAYRRVEAVDTKMCCGNVNFDIQKLVLLLKDGTQLELLIGEGTLKEAEGLYQALQDQNPQLQYGKQREQKV